jgi:signal transduction histidine kinase
MASSQTAPKRDPLAILILAPTGRDSGLLSSALQKHGIDSENFPHIGAICERLRSDAGAVLIAEEALSEKSSATTMSLRVLKAFAPNGNVSLLERPFRPITLFSALQVALRSRERQYQVRELLQKQVEATRMRDEFISIASHELKTPLTSLKLQAQISQRMLKAEGPEFFSFERVKKLVDTTDNQVDRLARLVEDMLDISRINTGKLTIRKSPVDLRELAQEIADRTLPQIASAGCTLTVDLEPEVVGHWDRYRIEQVIGNLMTNALRYASGKPIWLSVSREGANARLVVRDGGAGISPENQERIFQRFERAVSSGNISGLGLGLYICREILESHQGSIRVESEPGKGAAFIVELPLGAPVGEISPGSVA